MVGSNVPRPGKPGYRGCYLGSCGLDKTLLPFSWRNFRPQLQNHAPSWGKPLKGELVRLPGTAVIIPGWKYPNLLRPSPHQSCLVTLAGTSIVVFTVSIPVICGLSNVVHLSFELCTQPESVNLERCNLHSPWFSARKRRCVALAIYFPISGKLGMRRGLPRVSGSRTVSLLIRNCPFIRETTTDDETATGVNRTRFISTFVFPY